MVYIILYDLFEFEELFTGTGRCFSCSEFLYNTSSLRCMYKSNNPLFV